MSEIDFFRGLCVKSDEERIGDVAQRYCELLEEEGSRILFQVTEAHKRGDAELAEKIQERAKKRVAFQVALEYRLIKFERAPEPLIGDGTFIPPFGEPD